MAPCFVVNYLITLRNKKIYDFLVDRAPQMSSPQAPRTLRPVLRILYIAISTLHLPFTQTSQYYTSNYDTRNHAKELFTHCKLPIRLEELNQITRPVDQLI